MLILTITGLLVEVCLVGMVFLHDLRQHTIPFLGLYGLACLGYGTAVYWLLRRSYRGRRPLLPRGESASGETSYILGLAILFRATLLFTTPPTLSDDVYRYIWDGRLTNAGVNPYAYAVESPLLDRFDSPQRALVNNSWMASPYLPAAQALFAAVYRLAPESSTPFQVAAVLFDLLTGWLVTDLLRRLGLPRARALIYLWNPLVVVEFAHGAHIDALMICLMMAALWSLVVARRRETPVCRQAGPPTTFSVVALAAATLTKGLPALLLPVVARRWGWRRTIVYAGLIIAVCLPFALGAGWGLTGPLDGEGLFGALRIYASHWNYNGGIYHWLEVGLSGYWTPLEAVPPKVVGWGPIRAARLIVAVILGLVLIAVWRKVGQCDDDLALLRLATVPLAAYLLLTTTVHPWYVTLIIPLLPFLLPKKGGSGTVAARHRPLESGTDRPLESPPTPPQAPRTGVGRRLLLPWLYFSAAVSLSYLTYLDPANLREYDLVRLVEYVPLYLLLVWSAWPASGSVDGPGAD